MGISWKVKEASYILLIATALTPITTQVTTQQPSAAPMQTAWLTAQIPLLSALGIGAILAAIVAGFFQLRIHAKNREHLEKLDKAKRTHELEVQRLKAVYDRELENERRQWSGREKLLDDLQALIEDPKLSVRRFVASKTFGDLSDYLSEDARKEIDRLYGQETNVPTDRDEKERHNAYVESSLQFLLTQEFVRLKKEWGFI